MKDSGQLDVCTEEQRQRRDENFARPPGLLRPLQQGWGHLCGGKRVVTN